MPILYTWPIWITLVLFVAVLVGALEIGFFLGWRKRRDLRETETGGGSLVLSAVFALLGLIIAFTYGHSVNHYEARRTVLVYETNAISTAFMEAGLFKGRGGEELQRALLEYARTRVLTSETVGTPEKAKAVLKATLQAQSALWPAMERIVKGGASTPLEARLVGAISNVIDLHTARLTTSLDYLPPVIFWLLLFIAAMAVGMSGYTTELAGWKCRGRMFVFASVVAAVMYLIVDFDRPMRGFIRISQQPLLNAIADMEAKLARP